MTYSMLRYAVSVESDASNPSDPDTNDLSNLGDSSSCNCDLDEQNTRYYMYD